jgi:hypothetical protein
MYKPSSLFGQIVSCKEKSFITLAPRVDVINFYLLNLQMDAKGPLLSNIRLGSKGFKGINPLAYLAKL